MVKHYVKEGWSESTRIKARETRARRKKLREQIKSGKILPPE